MKPFLIYTALRLGLFVVDYAVLGRALGAVLGQTGVLLCAVPRGAPRLLAAVLKLLAPQRERFAAVVQARAERASSRSRSARLARTSTEDTRGSSQPARTVAGLTAGRGLGGPRFALELPVDPGLGLAEQLRELLQRPAAHSACWRAFCAALARSASFWASAPMNSRRSENSERSQAPSSTSIWEPAPV